MAIEVIRLLAVPIDESPPFEKKAINH